MANKNILISGAGIGGPALAYMLRKSGFNPTVIERAPQMRPGGQAVDLRGAGREVIESMGLMAQVRELELDQRGLKFVGPNGKISAVVPRDMFGGEGFVSEIEVLRDDLANILYGATASDVENIFDDTITALEQDGNGVTVTFEREVQRRFDLVVGADGLHSRVRTLAFGPEANYVQPLGCYTSWFTVPVDFDLDGWYLMHNARGGRVVSVRPGRRPGESKVSFSFRSEPLDYDRHDVGAQKKLLMEKFAGDTWLTPRLLTAMQSSEDLVFDSMAQVHIGRWSRGRIVLLGDAGYCPTPLTGLGTSLALVGAYVLAGELAAADGDYEKGFARYEEVARPYVANGQAMAPGGVASYAPNSVMAIKLRDASMRWMGRWPIRPLMAKQFAKASDIALPRYAVNVSG